MEIFLKVYVTYCQNGKIYDSVLAEKTSNKQVPQYSQSEVPDDQYRICKGCGWKLNLLLFTHIHLWEIHGLKLKWAEECLWKRVVSICGISLSNLHINILTPTLPWWKSRPASLISSSKMMGTSRWSLRQLAFHPQELMKYNC